MAFANAAGALRRNSVTIAIEAAVNIVLPYAIYVEAQPSAGDVRALLYSMAPPLVWSAVEFVRRRRIDVVSLFALAGIVLSLVAFVGGGNVKFLQLRENLVTAVFGLAFLVSALVRKPLIFELARASRRRASAASAEAFEKLVAENVHVRRSMTLMTLVWGCGLLAQTALACALVFALPIKTYLLASPILGYGTLGALAGWNVLYVRHMRRKGRRAAEDSARVKRD